MKKSVTRELLFPQSREEVWRALTDRASLAEWMFQNDFEARVGHRFTFQVPPNPQAKFEGLVVHCEILKCDPPNELSFSWVAGEVDTRIEYRLEANGSGTKVFFEQSGFEQDHAHRGAGYGWNLMHGKLTTLLSRTSV
jgi:uncharacterized protein YndB with AHSA1/START domain